MFGFGAFECNKALSKSIKFISATGSGAGSGKWVVLLSGDTTNNGLSQRLFIFGYSNRDIISSTLHIFNN